MIIFKTIKLNILIFIVTISIILNFNFCLESQAKLKAGTAKVNITPPVGIYWSFKGQILEGVADELYAKTLVLNDGLNTIAIVSTDLLWIPLEYTNQIRKIVKAKNNIPEENILIAATHTHYIPLTHPKQISLSKLDTCYIHTLIKKIAGSINVAYNQMKDSKIGAVKGEYHEMNYNRRTGDINSLIRKKNPNLPEDTKLPLGPIDTEVCIFKVEDTDGKIMATMVNYSYHPTAKGYKDSHLISAGFTAHTARVIEQIEGGICLYTQAAGGDMGVPIISSKGIVYGGEEGLPFVELGNKLSRQVGTALGAEALRRIQFVKMDDDITIKVLRKNVKLSIKKTPPPDSPGFIKSYYNRIIDHSVSTEYIITEIETIKIGDIYILTLPAEVLVNVGLEIKKRAGIKNLFIISNCNDAVGCICHSEAYEEGGHQSGGDTNLAKGTGEIVIEEALTMLNQIKQNR